MTPRQADLLVFIVRYQRRHRGASPAFAEIARGVGLVSVTSIHHHLRRLQRNGYIDRRYNATREIKVLKLPGNMRRRKRRKARA